MGTIKRSAEWNNRGKISIIASGLVSISSGDCVLNHHKRGRPAYLVQC